MTQMLIKNQFLKKEPYVKKAHLNILLGIIMVMSLDHYE